MVRPTSNKRSERIVDVWNIDEMQAPNVYFIFVVEQPSILQEVIKEVIEYRCATMQSLSKNARSVGCGYCVH